MERAGIYAVQVQVTLSSVLPRTSSIGPQPPIVSCMCMPVVPIRSANRSVNRLERRKSSSVIFARPTSSALGGCDSGLGATLWQSYETSPPRNAETPCRYPARNTLDFEKICIRNAY